MSARDGLLEDARLEGLRLGPQQTWGAIGLVPVLRDDPRADLRLWARPLGEDLSVVTLSGPPERARQAYFSYVPHAFVVSFARDGSEAAFGAQLEQRAPERAEANSGWPTLRVRQRMVKREGARQLRLLPLHLAMEGFLRLQFAGPRVVHPEYSAEALSFGLSPRVESSVPGRALSGLEDALRVFELHENQVGSLVSVAGALAAAFVVPTPADYRALHGTLLEDFYGELMHRHGELYHSTPRFEPEFADAPVSSLDELRQRAADWRAEWSALQAEAARPVLERPLTTEVVRRMGPFVLQRFHTDLVPRQPNHIGEAIVRAESGQIEYLKTYCLSALQVRRAYLLQQLARHDWELAAAASALKTTEADLVVRVANAGFAGLFRREVLERARRARP